MTTRLASILIVLTACAASPDPFADLPPYDADTGGGKFDDPNCSDESYRAFLRDYLDGKAEADATPCKFGNDASYRIWSYAVKQKLAPLRDAYDDATAQRQAGAISKDDVAKAGTLDDATRAALDKLRLVRPANAGKVGVKAWIDDLYAPAVQSVTMAVGPLFGANDQNSLEVTPYEAEWFDYISAARPTPTEAGTWKLWWDAAGDTFEGLKNAEYDESAAQLNAAWFAELAKGEPATKLDPDAAEFQTRVVQEIADDSTATHPRLDAWQQVLALQPPGGGPLAYKAWASAFRSVASLYDPDSHTDNEQAILDLLIQARPCGSGPQVDAIVKTLQSLPPSLYAAAQPTACTERSRRDVVHGEPGQPRVARARHDADDLAERHVREREHDRDRRARARRVSAQELLERCSGQRRAIHGDVSVRHDRDRDRGTELCTGAIECPRVILGGGDREVHEAKYFRLLERDDNAAERNAFCCDDDHPGIRVALVQRTQTQLQLCAIDDVPLPCRVDDLELTTCGHVDHVRRHFRRQRRRRRIAFFHPVERRARRQPGPRDQGAQLREQLRIPIRRDPGEHLPQLVRLQPAGDVLGHLADAVRLAVALPRAAEHLHVRAQWIGLARAAGHDADSNHHDQHVRDLHARTMTQPSRRQVWQRLPSLAAGATAKCGLAHGAVVALSRRP
jgi:hypothetical protein